MKKQLLKTAGSFIIAIMLVFASCNSNDSASSKTDKKDSVVDTPATKVAGPGILLNDFLDTLYIDSLTFEHLANLSPRRLTFRFVISSNKFTLHGWSGNSNSFNNKPSDVQLLISRQSPVQLVNGSRFGNLELTNTDVGNIRTTLRSKRSKFVLFAPSIPNSGTNKDEVIYTIYVTKDNPAPPFKDYVHMFVIDSAGRANPSPPRNSQ